MNNKIRILAILLIFVACVVTACNNQKEHIHQYSSDWTHNKDQHWHNSTCNGIDGCYGSVSELEDHNMLDGICTVCGYSEFVADSGDKEQGGNDNNENIGGEENKPTVCEHLYSSEQSKAPTCTESGEVVYKCTLCSDSYTESIAPTGHSVEITSSKTPGCVESGEIVYGCTLCDYTYSESIAPTGHSVEITSSKAPDCTESGEIVYGCTLCDYSYTEGIDPVGHTEESVSGRAPTCTESGFSHGKKCSVCGIFTVEQIEIYPTGHSFVDGVCSECGEEDPNLFIPDSYVIYTATTDNNCWVDKVRFTATESGEYTFLLPSGLGAWAVEDYEENNKGPMIDSLHPSYVGGEFSFSVLIREGEVYEFFIAAQTRQEWQISWSFVACEVLEDDEDETEIIPLEIGNNNFGSQTIQYSFTASHDGILTLVSGAAVSGEVSIVYSINGGEEEIFEVNSAVELELVTEDSLIIKIVAEGYSSIKASFEGSGSDVEDETDTLDISGIYKGTDAFGNQMLTVTIDSEAKMVEFYYYHPLTGPNTVNATYKIRNGEAVLYDESGKLLHPLSGTLVLEKGVPIMASFDGTQYSLSLNIPELDGEGEDTGKIVLKAEMTDGETNSFSVTSSDIAVDKMYVSFIPVNDGVYDFSSDHIFVEKIMTEGGVEAEKNEYDFYVLKSYVKYIVLINLEYIARPGDYTITPTYQYPAGHPQNPLWYTLAENTTAYYNGDYRPVWYQFYADVTGTLTVTTNTPGVTVMLAAVPNFDISAVETVSMDVVAGRKYYIGIAAYDSTEPIGISFIASITEGEITTDGSVNCPHIFELGENTIELEPYEGCYFIYKSTGNGTLTLSAGNVGFGWSLTDFSEQAVTSSEDITVHMNLGDLIYLYIEADIDISGSVSFTASFRDDAKQSWVAGPFILDGSEANVIEIDENTYSLFQIGGTIGRFVLSWDNPDATVEVNNQVVENGCTINVTSPWFGPYVKIYLKDYSGGVVNLTISPA